MPSTATSSSPSARWTAGRPASRWARRASRSTLWRSRGIRKGLSAPCRPRRTARSSVPGCHEHGETKSLEVELRGGKGTFPHLQLGFAGEVEGEEPVVVEQAVLEHHPGGGQVVLDAPARELRADLGAQLLAGGE